jgi:hypothetical protein
MNNDELTEYFFEAEIKKMKEEPLHDYFIEYAKIILDKENEKGLVSTPEMDEYIIEIGIEYDKIQKRKKMTELKRRRDQLSDLLEDMKIAKEALKIIAGEKQCVDNTLGNAEIAKIALEKIRKL